MPVSTVRAKRISSRVKLSKMAARLFVNWIASKEGLEVFSKARGEAPTRNDIDATAYLPKEIIPDPKLSYYDIHDWGEAVTARKKVMGIMQQLLRK